MEKTILSFVSGTIVEKLVSGPIVIIYFGFPTYPF